MCVKPELKTGKNALLSVAGWDTQEVEGGTDRRRGEHYADVGFARPGLNFFAVRESGLDRRKIDQQRLLGPVLTLLSIINHDRTLKFQWKIEKTK
jgi:hypothetical protein